MLLGNIINSTSLHDFEFGSTVSKRGVVNEGSTRRITFFPLFLKFLPRRNSTHEWKHGQVIT